LLESESGGVCVKTPSDFGFKSNPFPQHGVPPEENVKFAAYPHSELHEEELEKWLKSIYNENRPSCFIFVGDFGSGKSHLARVIRNIALKIGYEVKEEFFGTDTSLYDVIYSTNFRQKRTLIIFDEVQKLFDDVRRNPDAIATFKRQLRNFLECKKDSSTEKGFANVTILLFCTPQVKNVILLEEDLSTRFMLSVKSLSFLDPYIGLNAAKNFLQAYADEHTINTKLKVNPFYPFNRYIILSLINLCPLIVEKKGAAYRPTTRFLIELLRHCFDYMLEHDLDEFSLQDLPLALKETKVLDMRIDLSPNVRKIEEMAKTANGRIIAQFFGTALGWWTIHEISEACNLMPSEVEKVLHEELATIINSEQCWIINYLDAEKNVKSEIRKLGKRYEERIESIFSIPWITRDNEPCYLIIPSIHLIDENIERILSKAGAKQEYIYWLKGNYAFEVFHTSLERRFLKFSEEQIDTLRKFLGSDSISREQEAFKNLKFVVSHAYIQEKSIMKAESEYGDEDLKIIGLRITPHVATEEIYYRVGLKFLCVPYHGRIDEDFRKIVERLKTMKVDFIILLVYPELTQYEQLNPYMKEIVRWAPAYRRIFIRNLTEIDLVSLLMNHESFALFLEEIILDAIRNFNEGMLNEYLLMPLYGLKWAQSRLNVNHPDCIYPKLNEKWLAQALEKIEDNAIRAFIYENYKKPQNATFLEGENIKELFDENGNLKISEYERKVYRLLENQYRVEKTTLEEEMNKAFVYGALYKLKQANITPYQFIVEKLLMIKNLVRVFSVFDDSGQERTFIMLRKVSEEKFSILELIRDIRKKLRREEKISFNGDIFVFSNERYIQKTIDNLKLIEDYINNLHDTSDLLKRAELLTQLYCVERSLENLHKIPSNGFSAIIDRIRKNIENFEKAKMELSRHLESISLNFTPISVISVSKKIKEYLSRVSDLVNDGRLISLVEKELNNIETVISAFCKESEKIISIISDWGTEISDNNEKAKIIKNKKSEAKEILSMIDKYGLKEYFMTAEFPIEKDLFDLLSSFAKRIVSLEEVDEVDPNMIRCLLEELKEVEFKQFIAKYHENIQSKLDKIIKVFEVYSSSSMEFINKTNLFIASLENFWSKRAKYLENDINSIKESREGVSRALNLIEFYHKVVSDIGVHGVKIAHAMAFSILDSFLFLDAIQTYAEKIGISLKDFSDGLEALKRKGILREGVG